MKTLIICISASCGNTQKIAEEIAGILKAKLVKPCDVDIKNLVKYDLIGIGSGIYNSKHHEILLDIINEFPGVKGKKAFVFSTSSQGTKRFHTALNEKLREKGYEITGEFACMGLDTHGPLGIFQLTGFKKNKGMPGEEDIKNAKLFANDLKNKFIK